MTKPLFVLGTFCCFVLGGCVATVQKSKIVDKAPEVESQYIPDGMSIEITLSSAFILCVVAPIVFLLTVSVFPSRLSFC